MFKKYASVFAVLLLLTLVFTGCAASKEADMAKSENTAMAMEASQDDAGFRGEADSKTEENEQTAEFGEKKKDIRKVIKNGEIAVEVEDVDNAYSSIMSILNGLDGEEFNKSYYTSGEHRRMELVLKIPPENLDKFQEKLTELVGSGKIKRSNIRSQDITAEYYDTQSRLKSYETSRDQLRKLIEKAETVEDTLKIHNELTRIQAEIDVLQGRIKMWDKLVSMATITLYIDEEDDPMKHTKTVGWEFNSFQEIWQTMKNGFVAVVNTLYSLISWIIIIIVSLLPVLVPAGIVVWIVLRRRRKKKNKNNGTPPLA